ncbi:MAG: hypothetical protein ACRYG8_38730 [Janthinobacterium lividum]
MTAFTMAVAWTVISMAFLAGSAQAADKTAIGYQIAEAMIDIARHGNLHDVAYTHERLPLPFTLTRELNPQSKASDAAIQYYDLTLTRAQRGTMSMTYLVSNRGTLDPESSNTLTSYLYLANLSGFACTTADMLTSQFGPDERPENDGLSLVNLVVPLYRSDFTVLWLSYPQAIDHTGCLDHLGIAQRNLPEPSYQMPKVTRCPTVGECEGSEN